MKTYSILGWCKIFGVELVDVDGSLRGLSLYNDMIPLESFLHGICECTINPVDPVRYAVMMALI